MNKDKICCPEPRKFFVKELNRSKESLKTNILDKLQTINSEIESNLEKINDFYKAARAEWERQNICAEDLLRYWGDPNYNQLLPIYFIFLQGTIDIYHTKIFKLEKEIAKLQEIKNQLLKDLKQLQNNSSVPSPVYRRYKRIDSLAAYLDLVTTRRRLSFDEQYPQDSLSTRSYQQ